MVNSQEKAQLLPPRCQDADLPPIAPKISHNPTHQTWRRRTSAVTLSPYPARRCEIIGRKRQNTGWTHGLSKTYDGEFWSYSIFSQPLTGSRGDARRSAGAASYNLAATTGFRCAQPVMNCCGRGRARSTVSNEASPHRAELCWRGRDGSRTVLLRQPI